MAKARNDTGDVYHGGTFPSTHWSVVLVAAQGGSPKAAQALENLCGAYWFPLYAYARRQGHKPHDAQDLTQSFFLYLLEKNALAKMDPVKGRFRSFLLTAIRNFMINEWRRGQAQKHGGGQPLISLDAELAETRFAAEPIDNSSPEKVYDRNWAWALLDKIIVRLRDEHVAEGKAALFERLKPALMGERLAPSSAAVAAELNMSAEALRVSVYRLRRRFRKLLREEVAPTVPTQEEIDDEIRHLFASLGGQ